MFAALISIMLSAEGFCQAESCTTAPWHEPEVAGTAGVLVPTILNAAGGASDVFVLIGAEGRYRQPRREGFLKHGLVEGSVFALAPLIPEQAMAGAAGTLRLGLGFGSFAFAVGAQARFDATPAPFSILPSLAMVWRPSAFALSLGVLERPGGPLARISLEYGGFGVGYAAPLGAEAFGRVALTPSFGLEARAHVFRWFNVLTLGASVGVVWGEGAAYRFGVGS